MAQILKEEVRLRIVDAALRVFAERGFVAATMADIARGAGVSTGNLYRYFENKDVLFEVAIPPEFPAELLRRVRDKAKAAAKVRDLDALPDGAPWRLLGDELQVFTLAHRLRVVVVLARAEATPYAGTADDLRKSLVSIAIAHFRELDPTLVVGPAQRRAVELAYENLIGALTRVLAEIEEPAAARAAIDAYTRYHLGGLRALFA